jgi:hypothetical protein
LKDVGIIENDVKLFPISPRIFLPGESISYPFVLSKITGFAVKALGQHHPGRNDGKCCFGKEILDKSVFRKKRVLLAYHT